MEEEIKNVRDQIAKERKEREEIEFQ